MYIKTLLGCLLTGPAGRDRGRGLGLFALRGAGSAGAEQGKDREGKKEIARRHGGSVV